MVKAGDSLWGIARRYGVTVPSLAAANGMSPRRAHTRAPASRSRAARAAARRAPRETTRMTYQVRRGDTLSEIADKFNVSVRQLTTWNGLRQSAPLRTGQRLVVYTDPHRVDGG